MSAFVHLVEIKFEFISNSDQRSYVEYGCR